MNTATTSQQVVSLEPSKEYDGEFETDVRKSLKPHEILWVQDHGYLSRQKMARLTVTPKSLRKAYFGGVDYGRCFYLRLGNLVRKYKSKPRIRLCQNSFIYYQGATKGLYEGQARRFYKIFLKIKDNLN